MAGSQIVGGVKVPSYTVASFPDATVNPGNIIAASDRAGSLYYSDGTTWLPLSPSAQAIAAVQASAQTQAQQNLGNLIQAYSDLTPTKFLDVTATKSTGAGTFYNPYRTPAQASAAISGFQAGTILGIKRATTLTSQLYIPDIFGTADQPFIICPYGDSGALPLFDMGLYNVPWARYRGSIWRTPATAAQQLWQNDVRLFWVFGADLNAKLANLVASPKGYQFFDNGFIYANFYNDADPNKGGVVMSQGSVAGNNDGAAGICIFYTNASATGNILVTGMAVRHARDGGVVIAAPAATGSITTVNALKIVNTDIRHMGIDIFTSNTLGLPNGNDAKFMGGAGDALKATNCYVAGNYCEDIGNNSIEMWGMNGCITEFNNTLDAYGHGIAELWAACSSCNVRYNRCTWGALANQVGYGEGIVLAGMNFAQQQTNATVLLNASNTIYFNAVIGSPRDAFFDQGCPSLTIQNNTFITKQVANWGSVIIDNGGYANSAANPAVFSNNIIADIGLGFVSLLQINPLSSASPYTATGNRNLYWQAAENMNWRANNVAYATMALWQAGVTPLDVNSTFQNSLLDNNGRPLEISPAINGGGSISGFTCDLDGSPLVGIPIGAFSGQAL